MCMKQANMLFAVQMVMVIENFSLIKDWILHHMGKDGSDEQQEEACEQEVHTS